MLKKDLYLSEFGWVFGLGVFHTFAFSFGIDQHWGYNAGVLFLAWCSWAMKCRLIVKSYSSQYIFYLVKTPKQWAKSISLLGLSLMYLLAPLTQLLDFKLTANEGALSFTFLTLGFVPLRYFMDDLWIELPVQQVENYPEQQAA